MGSLTEKWSAASLIIHGQLGALASHCWPFVLSSNLDSSQRGPLATLRELQATVKKFSGSWCPEDVKRAVRHLHQQAEICVRKEATQSKIHKGHLCVSHMYKISKELLFR